MQRPERTKSINLTYNNLLYFFFTTIAKATTKFCNKFTNHIIYQICSWIGVDISETYSIVYGYCLSQPADDKMF